MLFRKNGYHGFSSHRLRAWSTKLDRWTVFCSLQSSVFTEIGPEINFGVEMSSGPYISWSQICTSDSENPAWNLIYNKLWNFFVTSFKSLEVKSMYDFFLCYRCSHGSTEEFFGGVSSAAVLASGSHEQSTVHRKLQAEERRQVQTDIRRIHDRRGRLEETDTQNNIKYNHWCTIKSLNKTIFHLLVKSALRRVYFIDSSSRRRRLIKRSSQRVDRRTSVPARSVSAL